jgi:hypothetical protein
MKKMLLFLFGISVLMIKAQFNSANEIVEFSKKNYSEKRINLVKNGWKKFNVEYVSGLESSKFIKTLSGVKFEIIMRSGIMPTSQKTINSTMIYIPKSKIVDRYLDEFDVKYKFKMLDENVIGYSEKNFSITITLGTDNEGKHLYEIKIITVK